MTSSNLRSTKLHRIALFALIACATACGSQVDLTITEPVAGDCDPPAPTASTPDGGDAGGVDGGTSDGGTSDAGASIGVDGGAPSADGGTPNTDGGTTDGSFCVTAPWTNAPTQFEGPGGATNIPAGTYTLRYTGGAQIHDAAQDGYEVTTRYTIGGLEAGHHLYNGADPYSSTTSVWLDPTGTFGGLDWTVADVERANAGHTWTIQHAGGPLYITYLDNDYSDNTGPGTRLCVDVGGDAVDAGAPTND